MTLRQSLIPCLRYKDAPAAIDFLCRAFGFETHLVVADEQDPGIIHHAQLRLGPTLLMLGSALPGETTERYRWMTPGEAGGITMCVCAVVEDPDALYLRAQAAGAEIVTPPHDNQGYPGRAFNARDPEGNDWEIGSFDPWAG